MASMGTGGTVSVILNGPGRVGREFVRLLSEQGGRIRQATGTLPLLRAVVSRRGILFGREGLSLDDVNGWVSGSVGQIGASAADWSRRERSDGWGRPSVFSPRDYGLVLDLLRRDGPGVVVEATPTDLVSGEPGLSHIEQAIKAGFSAISLAKGPLVVGMARLMVMARENRVALKYSGAVAAALPTVDTAMYSMALSGIYEIEGVLNGTTNFILNSMAAGKPYAEALKEAQVMGVAEADPRLDVEGFDSAAKILIIANTVWGTSLTLPAVDRQGITGLEEDFIRGAVAAGTPVRLVARATLSLDQPGSAAPAQPQRPFPALSVRPEAVSAGHPFANLPGTAKAIRFRSRDMGEVVVSGGASDVTGAAASALKDLLHILEERRRA